MILEKAVEVTRISNNFRINNAVSGKLIVYLLVLRIGIRILRRK